MSQKEKEEEALENKKNTTQAVKAIYVTRSSLSSAPRTRERTCEIDPGAFDREALVVVPGCCFRPTSKAKAGSRKTWGKGAQPRSRSTQIRRGIDFHHPNASTSFSLLLQKFFLFLFLPP